MTLSSAPARSARPHRRNRRSPGQGLLEFALILPILLLVLFGIIEFARILQAWLSVENAARFGVRYAVTGEFNASYCATAGQELIDEDEDTYGDNGQGTILERDHDPLTDTYDCQVPSTYSTYQADS